MKRITVLFLAVTMCLGLFAFGCGKADNKATSGEPVVMTVSINPSVEFVVDENGIVLSANALNEEGNLILTSGAFVGQTSDKALANFVASCDENGFLVHGEAGDNRFTVSLSGEQAAAAFESAKTAITNALSKENVQATVNQGVALVSEKIDELILACEPYYNEAKLTAMTYAEKVKLLAEKRAETAEMFSQQLKEAYYAAKENAYDKAVLNKAIEGADILTKASLTVLTKVYDGLVTALDTARDSLLTGDNSAYQKALSALREKKTAYLNYRAYVNGLPEEQVTDVMRGKLETYKTALETAEKALDTAYNTAKTAIETAKGKVTDAYNAVVDAIMKGNQTVKDAYTAGLETATAELENFETSFVSAHTAMVTGAKNAWATMNQNLKAGYTE